VTLNDLGLVIDLGHSGFPCTSPSNVLPFTILDVSGLHMVSMRFCECHSTPGGSLHRIQLLRYGWFPCTVVYPQSGFTFNVLNLFHLMTLQGKISAYDFYYALIHTSSNTDIIKMKDRYNEFLTAIRIWRHLKLLKRAGRGHDPAGISATKPGQLAIECPACSHPNRNLPIDWEKAPPQKQ
jgi:hypothetical protein